MNDPSRSGPPPEPSVPDPYDPDSAPDDVPERPDVPGRARFVRTPARDQPVPSDHLRRLWAPWRFAYVAGGAPIEGCPFCVLPERGPDRDRESLILHRGSHAYAILNAYPYNPGHVMICPFAHVADLEALDGETAAEIWELGLTATRMLQRELDCDGVNLGMNLGEAAGAGVAEHLHLHVVPRWSADTNFVSVVGATRVLPRGLAATYDALAPVFADL